MLNLIPVVVFLLMQGVGADSLTPRQQQALLGLAHRVAAVQEKGEGWAQVLGAIQTQASVRAGFDRVETAVEPWPLDDEVVKSVFSSVAARPRDGPAVS